MAGFGRSRESPGACGVPGNGAWRTTSDAAWSSIVSPRFALGSSACSMTATRSRRLPTDGRRWRLITALGEFDVAIVELAARPTAARGSPGLRGDPRAAQGQARGSGSSPTARAPRAMRPPRRWTRGRPPTSPRARQPDSLTAAVDAAADSERFVDPAAQRTTAASVLTRRQREILQLYADGRSTEEVAKRLGVSTETVRTHTKAVLARLDARDRAHAVAIGLRNSLIE